jgi:hypothetical protein
MLMAGQDLVVCPPAGHASDNSLDDDCSMDED